MCCKAREISVAQVLRPGCKHLHRTCRMEKLCVAEERIGLLDWISDHDQFADRSLRAHGADRARDIVGIREKVANKENHRAWRGGECGRQCSLEGPSESLFGRNRFGKTFDNALRRQWSSEAKQTCALAAAHTKIRERQSQQNRAVNFRSSRKT